MTKCEVQYVPSISLFRGPDSHANSGSGSRTPNEGTIMQ